MIDLKEYVEVGEYLALIEQKAKPAGSAQAAIEWFADHEGLERDDLEYVMSVVMRFLGHPRGDDWDRMKRHDDLDPLAWTWLRAWCDRYGFREATNEAGMEWNRTH